METDRYLEALEKVMSKRYSSNIYHVGDIRKLLYVFNRTRQDGRFITENVETDTMR